MRFYPKKIKKTSVNVIKNVTLFLLAFGIGSIDLIIEINEIIVMLWCCVIEYGRILKVSKSKYKIRFTFMGRTLFFFSFCT